MLLSQYLSGLSQHSYLGGVGILIDKVEPYARNRLTQGPEGGLGLRQEHCVRSLIAAVNEMRTI